MLKHAAACISCYNTSSSNSPVCLESKEAKQEWRFPILLATSLFELGSGLVDDDDCVRQSVGGCAALAAPTS